MTLRPIRYRITITGMLFVSALLVTGGAAFLSANNLLFLIFSAMMAFLLVSGFLSRLVLSGLEIELLLPEHVSARCPTPARIRIRNLKRFTPSFSIQLAGRRDPANNAPSILTAPLYFPLLAGRATIEAAVEVAFPFRGRHRENLFALSTRFPFGFMRKSVIVPLRRDTIVYPSLEPLEDDALLLDRIVGEMETGERGSGLEFYRIRPYDSADSARMVDWKTTAHTGALQVREFALDRQRVVEIYFDLRQSAEFERTVDRCAFAVWSLSERGAEVWFRSQRFSFAIPDDGEVYGILRYLALAEPIAFTREEPDRPLEDTNPRIAFTSDPDGYRRTGWSA